MIHYSMIISLYIMEFIHLSHAHTVNIIGSVNFMILSIYEFYFRGKSIFSSYKLRSFILLL